MKLARQLSGLLALLMLSTLGCFMQLFASPLRWHETGVVIRQGHHIEWQRAGFRAENGDVLFVWSDTRTGDRDVYAQKVNAEGVIQWQTGGVPIVTYRSRQEDPEPIEVTDGWIVTWIDFRDDTTGDVWAQKLDNNGNKQWASDGVLVNAYSSYVGETTLRAVHDGNGGALIAWVDGRGGDAGDIYAQHLRSDGTVDPAWPADGLAVAAENGGQKQVTAYPGNDGSMILGWQDMRSGDADIYITRIAVDGSLPWGSGGIVVCNVAGEQKTPKLCVDGSGGAFITWVDSRNGPTDLYIQHVGSEGNMLLQDNGQLLCDADLNQNKVRIAYDGNNGAICTWADYRIDGLESDIYAQKIAFDGLQEWTENGLLICDANYSQEEIRLIGDGQGGAIFAWEDTREQNGNRLLADVYVQRVDASGNALWAANGIVVIDSANMQTQPLLRSDGTGGALVVWSDNRNGSIGLRMQRLDNLGAKHLAAGGVGIVWGLDGDATHPLSVPLDFGRVACVWEDGRLGAQGAALYYQIIDSLGLIDLPMNGVPVAGDFPPGTQANQQSHQVCRDGNLGFFVVWEDQRTGASLIRAQHINILGETLWSAEGVQVAESERDQDMAGCVPDGNGGVYIAWSGRNDDWQIDIYVQRLNSSGAAVWAEPITLQDTFDDDLMQGMIADGAERAIVLWEISAGEEADVMSACVNSDGTIVWTSAVCDYAGEQRAPVIVSDNAGGAYYAWRDRRNLNDDDIYAQHLDASGAALWTDDGLAICSETNDQIRPRCASDEDGNLFVTWEDYRNGVDRNLYMQKVNPQGTVQFSTNGLEVVTQNSDQYECEHITEWGGGVYLVWTDLRSGQYPDVYAMHFDATGTNPSPPNWEDGGIVVNESENWQHRSTIVHDGAGGAITFWQDWRASGKAPLINIWAQRLNDYTVDTPLRTGPAVPEGYALESFPNPFNAVTEIRFSLPTSERTQLVIFDVLGRTVATLADDFLQAGAYRLRWDAGNVASGIYFCRLKTTGFQKTMKMTLLK